MSHSSLSQDVEVDVVRSIQGTVLQFEALLLFRQDTKEEDMGFICSLKHVLLVASFTLFCVLPQDQVSPLPLACIGLLEI